MRKHRLVVGFHDAISHEHEDEEENEELRYGCNNGMMKSSHMFPPEKFQPFPVLRRRTRTFWAVRIVSFPHDGHRSFERNLKCFPFWDDAMEASSSSCFLAMANRIGCADLRLSVLPRYALLPSRLVARSHDRHAAGVQYCNRALEGKILMDQRGRNCPDGASPGNQRIRASLLEG